jgi:hypothetical protein
LPSGSGREKKTVAGLTRELNEARQLQLLNEALEQQTATSDVLQVISSSPGELAPVFESLLASAVEHLDGIPVDLSGSSAEGGGLTEENCKEWGYTDFSGAT